ncbi:MAG: hypothetical protein V1682_02170 [Candidatus Omnitrophota bacterium]
MSYKEPDRRCELSCVPNEAIRRKVDRILINSFSPTGSDSSLMIGRKIC